MDGLTLVLDASTYEGSAAVLGADGVIAERTIAMRGITEERLMPAVAEVLAAAGVRAGSRGGLQRVVCGGGPGSFTSLRIAAGIAKGIGAGFDLPLFGVSSLHLAAAALVPGTYLLAMDAMREESYALAVTWDGGHVRELAALRRLPDAALEAYAASHGAAVVVAAPQARAAYAMLADIVGTGPVDRARWEPAYGRLAEAQVKWEAAHGRPLGE